MSVAARPRHPVTGRRFHLRAASKRELDAYMHRIDSLRTELRLGVRTSEEIDRELRHLRHGPVTVERAAVAYLERDSLAKRTKDRVRALCDSPAGGHLRPLLPLPIASLDGETLAAWIERLHRVPLHPTTIAMIWRTLRAIVRHAGERGWIGALPWGPWRPRLSGEGKRAQREATRSLEELVRLLLAARVEDDERALVFGACDLEAMIACAALLGLRQGELAGLRWPDVEPGPPLRVLVARQWENEPLKRGKRPQWIEAPPELGEILARHRARLEAWQLFDPSGPIFPARRSQYGSPRAYTGGEPLTRLNLRAAVLRAALPQVGSWSAHSLRDSFVTLEAAASGGDLARVALRSRHGSLASLARYLRALTREPAPPAFPGDQLDNANGAAPLLVAHAPHSKESPP